MLSLAPQITVDKYLVPYATVELAFILLDQVYFILVNKIYNELFLFLNMTTSLVSFNYKMLLVQGDIKQGSDLLNTARNFTNYALQSRLHLRIHAMQNKLKAQLTKVI